MVLIMILIDNSINDYDYNNNDNNDDDKKRRLYNVIHVKYYHYNNYYVNIYIICITLIYLR